MSKLLSVFCLLFLVSCSEIEKGGQVHLYQINNGIELCEKNGGLHFINHKWDDNVKNSRKIINSKLEFKCENGAVFTVKGDSKNYKLFVSQFLYPEIK